MTKDHSERIAVQIMNLDLMATHCHLCLDNFSRPGLGTHTRRCLAATNTIADLINLPDLTPG